MTLIVRSQIKDTRGSPVTSPSATSGGGTATGSVPGLFGIGSILKIRIVANGNTVNSDIELHADAARTVLLIQATGFDAFTNPHEINDPVFMESIPANLETIYFRFTNNGANNSTYTLSLVVDGGTP